MKKVHDCLADPTKPSIALSIATPGNLPYRPNGATESKQHSHQTSRKNGLPN